MKNVFGITLGVIFYALTSNATVSQSFTLDGRLYQAGSTTTPILDTGSFKIQVMGKTPVSAGIYCVLYEENRPYDTSTSAGYFSVKVGSAIADPVRGTADSGNSMSSVFSNTGGAINGKESGNGTTNCSYSPTSGEGRLVRIQVKRSDNSVRTLTPDMAIESVPSAVVAEWAETLQGLPRSSVLELGVGQLTQSNVENIFSNTNYPRLNQLVSVPPTNYVQSGSNGAAGVPTISGNPSSGLVAGQFWYDSAANVMKYYDGTSVQALGVSGSGITSLTAGTGLTGGTITTGGQTIAVDVGVGVGQIVQVETGGKVPALDGSKLTNLNGSAISTGIIGGSTAMNTSGNITTTGSVTAGSFSAATTGTKTLDIFKSDNSAKVSITANAGQLADYSLVLPVDDGAANQVLSTNGAGALSWVNLTPTGAASGDLTNNYPNPTVAKIRGNSVATTTPLDGQVYKWNNTASEWQPVYFGADDLMTSTGLQQFSTACTAASKTLTWSAVSDTFTCTDIAITNTQVSGLGTAAAKDAGTSAGQVLLLDGSGQVPVGNLPAVAVLDGGNTTTGAMSVGTKTAQNLSLITNNAPRLTVLSTGEVGIGTATPTSKLQVAGGIQIGTDAATCDATKTGAIRYNSGAVEFCNASAWTPLASGSSAISTLNGLTAATQTFAVPGSTGAAPAWSSAGSVHTLNIPLASATGVTAGLISKTEYDGFNTKLTSTLPDTQIFVGNSSNVATAVAMSGDATMANTGVVSLKSVGTAGTYYKVTTDAQGRVSSGVASLSLSDLPALNSAKIWVGDVSNVAAPVSVSGDGTMDNVGVLSIASVGTSSAANIHSAELAANAATAANTASKIVARDGSGNFAANLMTGRGIVYNDTQGTPNSVTLQAPNTVTTSYTLKFPAAQGGATTVLVNDGAGNLSWAAQSSGSVTSVGASAPLSSTGGATPSISIQQADGTHDGYLTQGDWISFNGKLTSTLADGSIFVGNSSNVATAVAPSGDVALTNAGAMTVNAIKGKTVTAAPTLSGQVLRYDGTNLVPNFVSMRDLRSNVTGSTALAATCTASQTLTYNSVADDLTCSNISIASNQISGLGTAAAKDAGTSAGQVLLLDGSGKIATSAFPATVIMDGGNTPGATLSVGTTNANSLSLVTNGTGRVTITSGGNVGIGGSPASNTKLDVSGQIRAPASSIASGSVDFSGGNTVTTSFDCGSNITLANMRDGGSYSIVVTGTGTTQCSFSTSATGDDAATVSYRFQPANGVRIASSHTIYSLLRVGNVVYVAWITGF